MRLPIVTFKFGIEMLFLREPHAKIGDKLPRRRNFERAAELGRIEDRYPSNAKILCTRTKTKSVDRGAHRKIQRLRHGLPAKTRTRLRRMVAEHREMHRRLAQPR